MDKNAAYPAAVDDLKAEERLPETTELRLVLYLNNRVEQDHRNICAIDMHREWDAGSFNTARAFLERI